MLPSAMHDEMISSIKDYCLENNVLLAEAPKFVQTMLENRVPFGKVSKMAKELNLDYQSEVHATNKKSIEDLPPKIKDSVYKFQKQGIQYGLLKFGRMLLGDEMGVGKTV